MFNPNAYKKELLQFIAGALAVNNGFSIEQLVSSNNWWNRYMAQAEHVWSSFEDQNGLTILASPVPGKNVFECYECDRLFDSENDAKNCARTDKQRLWQ